MTTNLGIKDFQDEKFNSSDFVNNFIEKTLTHTVDFSSLEKCNLADLNKVLESTLKNLKKIKDEINHEMEGMKLDRELNHASLERNQDRLADDMSIMKVEFENLEKKIVKFADKSINIGTHLSQLDREKEAAILTSELIDYFIAFNTPDLSKFPDLFKDNKNYEISARYVFYLNEVSQNLTTSEFSVAQKNIAEKFEQMKKILYIEFNDKFAKKDLTKLHNLLPYIVDFDLLQDVAMHYIVTTLKTISNDMIFELRTIEENKKSVDTTFINLMRILKNELISEENFFMTIIEDRSIEVIKQFISYVFENYIAKALERIKQSFGKNEELYLRYYEIIYLKTQDMIQDIYKMDFEQSSMLHETSRAYFHNVFDEYQAHYLQHEAHFLTSLFEKNVERIQKQLEKQKEKELHGVGNINKIEKFKLSRDEAATRIELLRDILMHESTELMFSSLDQSVQRCLKICRFDEKNNNAIYLANKFLEYFGTALLGMLVDFGAQIVPDLSRKTELNENFFEIIFKLNSLVQRVEIAIYKSARDLIKDSKYEQLIQNKEKILHNLEGKIERTIQKAITSLTIFVNKLLVASRDKNEYYIKGSATAQGPTPGSRNLVNFLTPYINQIKSSYSENIKRRILSRLGSGLLTVLIDHFGDAKVNAKGAVLIQSDLDEYEKMFDEFDDQNVMDEFETLRALTHIYSLENKEVDNYLKTELKLKNADQSTIERYKYNRS